MSGKLGTSLGKTVGKLLWKLVKFSKFETNLRKTRKAWKQFGENMWKSQNNLGETGKPIKKVGYNRGK